MIALRMIVCTGGRGSGEETARPDTLSLSPRKTLEDRGGGSGVDLRKALSLGVDERPLAHSLSTVNENYSR